VDNLEIARVLHAPTDRLAANWPPIEAALLSLGMNKPLHKIAALATVAVECPLWTPATEKYNGEPHVYFARYDGRLGNVQAGDGYKFRGRGFIQITGRRNYELYGRSIGVDLVSNPDLALQVGVSARLFAAYFHINRVAEAAEAQDWTRVRRLVNGGTNGLEAFLTYVDGLKSLFNV
jgi:predicted chitinase